MMLHRHFEGLKSENMTKLADVSQKMEGEDFFEESTPSEEKPKRGRPKKKIEE